MIRFVGQAVAGFVVWWPLWKVADHLYDRFRETLPERVTRV